MVLSKITDFCISVITTVIVLSFVLGVLTFNKDETYGVKTVGNVAKASFTAGFVFCEFTGICVEGESFSVKLGNFMRFAMGEFTSAKRGATDELSKLKKEQENLKAQQDLVEKVQYQTNKLRNKPKNKTRSAPNKDGNSTTFNKVNVEKQTEE